MSLHPGAGYTVVAALLVAFLAARLATAERRSLLTGLALFFLCLGLLALAGALRPFRARTGPVARRSWNLHASVSAPPQRENTCMAARALSARR